MQQPPAHFPHANRSTQRDRLRGVVVGMALLALLFVALLVWLVAGRVPFYQVSRAATLTDDALVVALFGDAQLVDITLGQPARIAYRLADAAGVAAAQVIDSDLTAGDGYGTVTLLIDDLDEQIKIVEGGGQIDRVQIEIESVSPLRLIFSGAGVAE